MDAALEKRRVSATRRLVPGRVLRAALDRSGMIVMVTLTTLASPARSARSSCCRHCWRGGAAPPNLRRMPNLLRTTLPLLAFVALASCATAQPAIPPTVVVIVRHADKAAEPANDPPLTPTGVERAQALAILLGDAKVGVVMHTPTTRTRETARPVAERFGLTPVVLPLGPAEVHASAVVEAVRLYPGRTIVIVGHSNTIMRYIAALGGPTRPDLCDHQYDGIYTLILDGSSVRLVEARYGPENPPQTAPCAMMQPGR